MESVDTSKKLVVQYENFCDAPHQAHKDLVTKLDIDKSDSLYTCPRHFKMTRVAYLTNGAQIEKALSEFSSNGEL